MGETVAGVRFSTALIAANAGEGGRLLRVPSRGCKGSIRRECYVVKERVSNEEVR